MKENNDKSDYFGVFYVSKSLTANSIQWKPIDENSIYFENIDKHTIKLDMTSNTAEVFKLIIEPIQWQSSILSDTKCDTTSEIYQRPGRLNRANTNNNNGDNDNSHAKNTNANNFHALSHEVTQTDILATTNKITPPHFGEFLISLFLPQELRDAILGDLEEEFNNLVPRLGAKYAQLIYWKQAVLSILFLLWPKVKEQLLKLGLLASIEEYIRRHL